jgi:hypothetical protein
MSFVNSLEGSSTCFARRPFGRFAISVSISDIDADGSVAPKTPFNAKPPAETSVLNLRATILDITSTAGKR